MVIILNSDEYERNAGKEELICQKRRILRPMGIF